MTENEAKEILLQIAYDGEYPIGSSEAFSIAIQALEEIQQYRSIGTVEELVKTQIREKVLNVELESYKEIGTIEEFKALKVENEELHCEIQAINATMELLENEIRAKAIDEFMEKVKPIIDEKIKGWTNSDDLRRWCARAVDEITEQMKASGENE